jgi:Predicted membrane protein
MNHNWIRAGFLAAFAFLILYLDRLGQLPLYIAPRMELYVKLSAIVLNAAAVHQVFLALGRKPHSADCEDCGHDHSHHNHDHHDHHDHDHDHSMSLLKSIVVYGLFLLPLLLGFLLPAAAQEHEANSSGIPHLHSGSHEMK